MLQLLPVFVGNLAALLQVEYGLTVGAVLQGLAVGVLVSLLFSVVPLLEVRNVKPSLLLRQDVPPLPHFDWLKWTVAVGGGRRARRRRGVASRISAGRTAARPVDSWRSTFVLHLAGVALIRAVQPLRFSRSFALRQAVLHVARPGNQTRIILLAVGLGTFFILGVRALQVNLLQDFSVQVGEDAPDMFLMDIQSDQRDGLAALIDRENGAENVPKLIPVLRARIIGVRGRDVNLESYEDVRGRGGLSREFTDHLSIRRSRRTRSWSMESGGTPARRPISPRCRSRRASASASTFRSETRCGSTSSVASCRRGSPAFARSTFATFAPAAS